MIFISSISRKCGKEIFEGGACYVSKALIGQILWRLTVVQIAIANISPFTKNPRRETTLGDATLLSETRLLLFNIILMDCFILFK